MRRKAFSRKDPETGLVLLALIIIMLVLGVVAYTFVTIVSTSRYSTAPQQSSAKALYISEAALEIGKKYVADVWASGSYPTWYSYTIFYEEPLGDGTFSVWVTGTSSGGFVEFTASAECDF